MIIDCHGHYTTAPPALGAWRDQQIAGLNDPATAPRPCGPAISDDELRDSIEANQLRLMDERGIDMTIFSPAGVVHGPPRRRLRHLRAVGGHLQRTLLPGQHAVPGPVRARRDAPAVPRRRPGHLHPGTDPVRRGIRRRRAEPEPRPLGRALDRAAADRPLLVPHLREDGRVRHPGDGARQHQRQPGLPHHRRALPQRRHHRLHAADRGRPVRRLPHPAAGHPARRRRRALPLGPVPRPGDGDEEATAGGARPGQCLLRHLRLPPARHRPAARRHPHQEHPVRLRDDRRRPGYRPLHRSPLRRHPPLHRERRALRRPTWPTSRNTTPAPSTRG